MYPNAIRIAIFGLRVKKHQVMELKSQFNLLELGPLGCLQRLHAPSLFMNADNRLIWLWTRAAQLHVPLLTLSRLIDDELDDSHKYYACIGTGRVSCVHRHCSIYLFCTHNMCVRLILFCLVRGECIWLCICLRASARGWASGFLSMFAWLSKPTGSLALCIAIALVLFSQQPRIIRVQSAGNRHQVHWLHWWHRHTSEESVICDAWIFYEFGIL